MSKPEAASNAKSAERTLVVLRYLAERARPVPAASIARSCGIPRSSTYHLLAVMRAEGFVNYYPEKRLWGLGPVVYEIGTGYLQTKPMASLARPLLERLARETEQATHLAILHGKDAMYVLKEVPAKCATPHLVTREGLCLPAHLTAVGRAILMCLSSAQLQAIYPATDTLVRRTRRGPFTRAEFERQLDESRPAGYAVENGMTTPGISCIGAPVFAHCGCVVGAVGISFSEKTVSHNLRDSMAEHMLDTVSLLSSQLGWHPPEPAELGNGHSGHEEGTPALAGAR